MPHQHAVLRNSTSSDGRIDTLALGSINQSPCRGLLDVDQGNGIEQPNGWLAGQRLISFRQYLRQLATCSASPFYTALNPGDSTTFPHSQFPEAFANSPESKQTADASPCSLHCISVRTSPLREPTHAMTASAKLLSYIQ